MSLIGKTLGHYKIGDQPLGRGGMGEVYRAKDLKLGRDVAIKVLPEEFARDPDRVARFQREAKLLASLNHPNIAAIYGLEESGGIQFLVLELVEGETLSDQLKRDPIPVEESLKLALQIAEALEAAHEKGVIHRDLKPANIKVTPEGKVKVLDFGLAKAFAGEQADVNSSNSPTLSIAATQQGVILGTAAYMSPEQARGKAVDKRTDIWAFGCVLFEMLTGRAAFSGKDVTDILAAVIRAEPEWGSLPPILHWRLREVLERCLKKEIRDRYHDVSDVRIDIQRVLADPGGVLAQAATTVGSQTKLRQTLLYVVAVLGILIGGITVWILKPGEPRQTTRLYHELPKEQQFEDLFERALAVSPDGRQFVFTTTEGLYLRYMNQLDAILIPGTKGAQNPFFSPDGKWIGYVSTSDKQLKKIEITGGSAVKLTNASSIGGYSWGADDTIVYSHMDKGIMRLSSNGGVPELIVKAESEMIVNPQILPDGKSVLFSTVNSKIMVQSLESGKRKQLMEGQAAYYLPTGHLVYTMANNLFAVPFNPSRLELEGGKLSVVEGVLGRGGAPQFAVSDSGTLVYIPGTGTEDASELTLVWVDRNGKEEPLTAPAKAYFDPRISPDGMRVALTAGPGISGDIYIWDFDRKTLTRLTFDKAEDSRPIWSPDGKKIVFHTHQKDAPGSVYWKAADGTGEDEAVGPSPGRQIFPCSWSRDGKTLVVRTGLAMTSDIGTLSMEGDRKYRPLLQETYAEVQPLVSPDGRWMAYTSDESDRTQVYVRPFPEVNKGRWQVSTGGGNSPLWSPDGRELFYRNGDAVMAVPVKTEPAFSYETAKELFRGTYYASWTDTSWDIHPDGKRFLMMKEIASADKPAAAATPRKINIVLNWFEELKQRVPAK